MNSLIKGVFATVALAGAVALGVSAGTPTGTGDLSVMRDSSVQIKIAGGGSCSGTIIKDPYLEDGEQTTILTAGHCGKVGGLAFVTDYSILYNQKVAGVTYGFVAVAESTEADVLIYQAETKMKRPEAPIYGGNVSFGDKLFVTGYGRGLPQDLVDGYAAFIESDCAFTSQLSLSSCEMLRISAPISPGNSGSAVWKELADGSYEVVGVVSAAYSSMGETSSKYAWSVTTDLLRSFLKKVAKDGIEA